MPRYYFTLHNASKTLVGDGMGQEFENDEAARQFARNGAGFFTPGPAMSAPYLAYHRLQVVNQAGESICILPVSKLADA